MQDIFGRALFSCYRGEREATVLCREDGHRHTFDLQDLFTAYHEWPEYEKRALTHVVGKVLDIGCGAGRHSLWLQEIGYDVVGIDISPLAVRVAEARGLEKVVLMAAQELAFEHNYFETILLMGNNFGIRGNVTGTERMMRQMHRITSRHGCIIAVTRDVTTTVKPEHLMYQELNRKRGRPIGQITLRIEYRGEVGEWFDLLMVSPRELEDICRSTGWAVEKILESENGLYASVLRKSEQEIVLTNPAQRKQYSRRRSKATMCPDTLPRKWVREVEKVDNINLSKIAS